jgi:hypothetical protein
VKEADRVCRAIFFESPKRSSPAHHAYSKKLENLRHAMAIFIAHFNLCRIHSAHGKTPAQAAHLTDHQWTIEEMLAETN